MYYCDDEADKQRWYDEAKLPHLHTWTQWVAVYTFKVGLQVTNKHKDKEKKQAQHHEQHANERAEHALLLVCGRLSLSEEGVWSPTAQHPHQITLLPSLNRSDAALKDRLLTGEDFIDTAALIDTPYRFLFISK